MASKDIDLLKRKITDYLTDINTLRKNNETLDKKVKDLESNLGREKNINKKILEEKQNLIKEMEELKAAKVKPRTTRKTNSPGKKSGTTKTTRTKKTETQNKKET